MRSPVATDTSAMPLLPVSRRLASLTASHRESGDQEMRRAGADHLVLSTAGDWLQVLAGHLRRNEAALRAGNPGRTAVANRMGGRR